MVLTRGFLPARIRLPEFFARMLGEPRVDERPEEEVEEEAKVVVKALEEVEPYDGETLHAALCARREAGLIVPLGECMSFGLFAPGKEKEVE